jgi:hypothetical protein
VLINSEHRWLEKAVPQVLRKDTISVNRENRKVIGAIAPSSSSGTIAIAPLCASMRENTRSFEHIIVCCFDPISRPKTSSRTLAPRKCHWTLGLLYSTSFLRRIVDCRLERRSLNGTRSVAVIFVKRARLSSSSRRTLSHSSMPPKGGLVTITSTRSQQSESGKALKLGRRTAI